MQGLWGGGCSTLEGLSRPHIPCLSVRLGRLFFLLGTPPAFQSRRHRQREMYICKKKNIYICCRRGILASWEGESWPEKRWFCRTKQFFEGNPGQCRVDFKNDNFWPGFPSIGVQIPLFDFLSRKRLFWEGPEWPETTIFTVVSRNSGPLSYTPPKIARTLFSAQWKYYMSVWRGGFLYILPLSVWACNFYAPLHATLAAGFSWNPYFCSVLGHVEFWKIRCARGAPGRLFCWPGAFPEFWPQKCAKK